VQRLKRTYLFGPDGVKKYAEQFQRVLLLHVFEHGYRGTHLQEFSS
jgi:hypothetical protein